MLEACGRSFRVLCGSCKFAPTTLCFRQYSTIREARNLKKLITGGAGKTKKKWYGAEPGSYALQDLSFLSSKVATTRTEARQKPAKVKRRVGVLNAIFMEQITSLLSTGEVAEEVLGLGLEITAVRVSPDFSCINVYWFGTGTDKDETVEKLLVKIGFELRHVLSQLRVIGSVPPIKFVKDMKYAKMMDVERLLAQVDMGEDFVPSVLGASMKAPPEPPAFDNKPGNISSTLQNEILDLGGEDIVGNNRLNENGNVSETPASDMRHDVLGLDHKAIMAKIQLAVSRERRKLNRSKEPRLEPPVSVSSENELDTETGIPPVTVETPQEIKENARLRAKRQDDFLIFLKKRRIAKIKDEQRTSTEARNREFQDEERRARWLQGQNLMIEQAEFEMGYKEKDDDFIEDEMHEDSPSATR